MSSHEEPVPPPARPPAGTETQAPAASGHGDDSASAPPPSRPLRIGLLAAVALTGLVVDVVTKVLVVAELDPSEPLQVPGGFLQLRLLRNAGAAFSLATGMTWLLSVVAVIVVVAIVRMARRLRSAGWAVGLGLVLAGALGNLTDRVFRAPGPFRGHVVDFLALVHDGRSIWPVFNVADSCIVCGGILLVLLAFLGREPDGTRAAARRRGAAK